RGGRSLRRHGPQPEPVAEALELLADSVEALERVLEEPGHEVESRRLALRAAAKATSVLPEDPPMSTVVVIGQIRSTALDLLQGSGLSADEAQRALDAAADARSGLLADSVEALERVLEEPGHEVESRRLALRAAAKATSVLPEDPPMSTVVVIGQIRSTALDLLQGSGLSADEAQRALDAAADA